MSKSPRVRETTDPGSASTEHSQSFTFDQICDEVAKDLACRAVISTSLPRGSLQIAQPQSTPESFVKNYTRVYQSQDRAAWGSLVRGAVVRGTDEWSDGQYASSPFVTEFLRPHGFEYSAAVALDAPLLPGYPGVLEVFRTAEQGDFSDDDLQSLEAFARRIDTARSLVRESRPSKTTIPVAVSRRAIPYRQFILNGQLQAQFDRKHISVLDDRLRQQMFDHARQQFSLENGTDRTSDRVALPDSHGDLWIFRVIIHQSFPALGEGPFAFFFLQPECDEWTGLRASDFLADAELSRLIPALRYMEQEFSNGPTLHDIARTVHLSPFHFHRRFTELLGITPKHFLLSCQIDRAKRMLVEGERELADIAKECGFAHQSHFTSRFKQASGLTPTRWRRLARDKGRVATA